MRQIETRRGRVTPVVGWFEDHRQWSGLRCFAAVECQRAVGDQTSSARRHFISSLPGTDAQALVHAVRSHGGIENKRHWVLAGVFNEDASRLHKGHGAENCSRLRRIALNLLKQALTARLSIKKRRLRAGGTITICANG